MKNTRQETVTAAVQEIINYHDNRTSLAIHNLGSATVYYGSDSEVTTSSGFPLLAGQTVAFSKQSGDDPRTARWFIGSGTDIIAIGEEYLKNNE